MHIAFIAIAIAAVLSMVTTSVSSSSVLAQTQTTSNVEGSFANVKVIQDEDHIVITVSKSGEVLPDGPIVIVPPENEGENGTIIAPTENQTSGNVTVIEPDGTVTEVPGNVTQIDNSTVVIVPDNQTVTETPGNVTVIDPVPTEPCGCPEPEEQGPIAPVVVTPAPGQNVTTGEQTVEEPETSENVTTTEPTPEPFPESAPPVNVTDPTEPAIEPFPEPVQNETAGNNVTEGGSGGGSNASEGGNGVEVETSSFLNWIPGLFQQ